MSRVTIPAKQKWPLTNVAVVSSNQNLQTHCKEMVRTFGWKFEDPPTSADIALGYIQNGTSFILMIDDEVDTSALESIRLITQHPVGRLTPLIAVLSQAAFNDRLIYQKVLQVSTVKKPITPNQFLPAFEELLKLWEQPVYTAIRKCAYAMINGDTEAMIPVLFKLSTLPQAAPFTVPSLLSVYAESDRWSEGEAFIMNVIKSHGKIPGIFLAIADYYARGRMPAQALRFYQKLRSMSGNSPSFSFDIANAAISIGNIELATQALIDWQKLNPSSELINSFIARLYVSEGRDYFEDKHQKVNSSILDRIKEIWESIDQSTAPKAAS